MSLSPPQPWALQQGRTRGRPGVKTLSLPRAPSYSSPGHAGGARTVVRREAGRRHRAGCPLCELLKEGLVGRAAARRSLLCSSQCAARPQRAHQLRRARSPHGCCLQRRVWVCVCSACNGAALPPTKSDLAKRFESATLFLCGSGSSFIHHTVGKLSKSLSSRLLLARAICDAIESSNVLLHSWLGHAQPG